MSADGTRQPLLQEMFIVNSVADPADRPAPVVMAPAIAADDPYEKRPGLLARFFDRMAWWQDNARQRHAIRCLAPHLMKDIGVSEVDIWQETRKPIWRD